ncbi:hypothetical protein D3C71_1210330 [compost metagenome]
MYLVAFKIKKGFMYSWDGLDGSRKLRNFIEGGTCDLIKTEGSVVPVSSTVLCVLPQVYFDPHDYVYLLLHKNPYSESSIKITGYVDVPPNIELYYELDAIYRPIPAGMRLFRLKGLFGREHFITSSGVKVNVKAVRKKLSVIDV